MAKVYVAELPDGSPIEFVQSRQPPLSWEDKWVLIVSVLRGCPVKCPFCDANIYYRGRLSTSEILDQILYMVDRRYPDRHVTARKFKIQFARMGEPAFNDAVLDVLEELPRVIHAPGLMPSISTVAPASRDGWFTRLERIKETLYPESFQFQFSIHTTDEEARQKLIPIRTWSFRQMAQFGTRFHMSGGRKITLNFATPEGYPLDAGDLARHFSPEHFAIKFTPVNPTVSSVQAGLSGVISLWEEERNLSVAEDFRREGFDVILSIGEYEENEIGSNCGMFVTKMMQENISDGVGYGRLRQTVTD